LKAILISYYYINKKKIKNSKRILKMRKILSKGKINKKAQNREENLWAI